MATTATKQLRIVANGGPITKDVYKAYYSDGTAASEDWKAGELLSLVSGYLKRCISAGSAAKADTDDAPLDAAYKRFIALTDHDSSAAGAAAFVSVQEILDDTILEIQVAASSTTAPTQANVSQGVAYGAYKSASDVWGLDVDESGAKGIFVVVNKDADLYNGTETGAAGTAGSGRAVRVTVKQALML